MQEVDLKKIKFSEGCELYLIHKQNTVKESTYYIYKFAIEKHLKPDLGKISLYDLQSFDFNDYIRKKKKKLQNIKYNEINNDELKIDINSIIIKLKGILKFFNKKYKNFKIDLELINKQREDNNEIEVFTEKEKKLIKYLMNSKRPKDLGILIGLYSGLRIGEVCGLKWGDIDFDNKLINVQRTVQRIYLGRGISKLIVTAPKTKKSKRKVPISKSINEKLKVLSKSYSDDSYILTGKRMKCTEPLTYRYAYKNVLRNCGITYRKFHCLRHTFATRCIRVGMDIKSLSEVLGHSNIGITLDIYVHSSYEVKKKYIDRL